MPVTACVMAWRMRLKLPSYKVTQRIGAGVVRCSLPRGRKDKVEAKVSDSIVENQKEEEEEEDGLVEMTSDAYQHESDVSLHAIKQKAATEAWNHVRSALLKAAVESSAMPAGQHCINCSDHATHRCLQCAPCAYYCYECFVAAHSRINFFHTGEIWEVFRALQIIYLFTVIVYQDGAYKPVTCSDRVIDVRVKHVCSSDTSIRLCCLDESGRMHKFI